MKIPQLLILCLLILSLNLQAQNYQLNDFFNEQNIVLECKVDSIFNTLSEREKVAQMIITSMGDLGKSDRTVEQLVSQKKVGGVIFLKGEKADQKRRVQTLNNITRRQNGVPLLFSMDAEPSLINGRLKGSKKIGPTVNIKSLVQSDIITNLINTELKEVGVLHNYAPVLDVSTSNAAIKKRSYGSNKDSVVLLANRFIQKSQEDGIIATAKHFPGHGLVKGDTHKKSVFIDGEMLEVDNYKPLIKDGVLSIMVAHIVVKNNRAYDTNGMPSTLSENIVTGLLREKLNFKGIIITDALNIMKAVTIHDNAPLLASKAGCDILLMPISEERTINSILEEMARNPFYEAQVHTSIRRILRLKICAGLM